MAISLAEPSSAEKIEAYFAMAEQTTAMLDSKDISTERVVVIGNYLIACSFVTPYLTDEALGLTFGLGLINAGTDVEQAVNLTNKCIRRNAQRYFFSLSYVPDDKNVPGIIRRKRSIMLDEPAFIRGILQAKDETASSAG